MKKIQIDDMPEKYWILLMRNKQILEMSTNEVKVTGPTVVLTKEEYDKLVEDSEFLQALRNAGVDNWDGYSYALEELEDGENK